jgi:hypothetical protein
MSLVQQFYGAAPPDARSALLDRLGITHLVLPGDAGAVPSAWLGEATDFRRIASVGTGEAAIAVYHRRPARARPPGVLRSDGVRRRTGPRAAAWAPCYDRRACRRPAG